MIPAAFLMINLAADSSLPRLMDSPAADTSPNAFFLKAAEYRAVPEGTDRATAETMVRAAKFLMSDKGIENNAIRDEKGDKVPPYIYHAVIDDNDHFSYRISYPAYHHAYLIEAFLNYYNYSGDAEAMRRARQLADWTIEHSTGPEAKWPYLPWSTYSEGKPGGLEDKDALQPDKVGYMGLAYTRLFEVTGAQAYFDAAKRAADTLVAKQGYDGSWPFRVNPFTDEERQQYSSALYLNVAFLEKMHALTGDLHYKQSQILAWMWLMRNPVRTNNWSGLYEDIPVGSDSQVHYSPLQVIRLLLRYHNAVNESSYLPKARALFDYTMDGLGFVDRDMGLIMREQTAYPAATPSSTLNWSMMAAEFYLTTGEDKFRQTVLDAVRMVNRYGLKPDGRTHNTVLGPKIYGNDGSWYSLTSPTVRYLYQDMGCLPELAPSGENHLLRTSSQIRSISYEKDRVDYTSLKGSVELLKLARAPSKVTVGGREIRTSAKLASPDCYYYNPRSHVLVVQHVEPDVSVRL
jgi:rhamnogalacturonyl hydrolase YesR